jgi:hypothetical protein
MLILAYGSAQVFGQGGTGKLPPPRMPPPIRKMPPNKNPPPPKPLDRGILKTVTLPLPATGDLKIEDGFKCRIRVTLNESGKVVEADFESSRTKRVCSDSKSDAKRQQFSPATVNGNRVKSTGWIEYIFTDKDKNTPTASPSPSPPAKPESYWPS